MREEKQKKVRVTEEEQDLINNLPNELLVSIISFLPGMEAVRTSVLSQSWKKLWMYSSHLGFDQINMFKPLIDVYIRTFDPNTRLQMALNRKKNPEDYAVWDKIAETSSLIESIINNHIGSLKSSTIRHLCESCASGDVERWMKKLLEKRVTKVSMENESPNFLHETLDFNLRIAGWTLNLPFDIFSNFEVLKLKNYHFETTPSLNPHQILKTLTLNNVRVASNNFQLILSNCLYLENLTLVSSDVSGDGVKIHSLSLKYLKLGDMNMEKILVSAVNVEVIEINSIICNHEDLVFETPKLHVLRAYNNMKSHWNHLLTRNIIEICGGILGHRGSSMGNIFDNLVTLCIDLHLGNIRDVIALSFALKSCHQLKHLQINTQVKLAYNGEMYDQNDNDCLPYPVFLFWQQREPCWCITNQLKSLCIKGYKGGKLEVEFVKYVILNGGVIENISIWFVGDCSWFKVVETICLLSYPRISPKLSIDLKPGEEYMRKDGGSFEKWVTTLSKRDC